MRTKSALTLLLFFCGIASASTTTTTELTELKQLNLPAPAVGAKDIYGDQVLEDLIQELSDTELDMRVMAEDFNRDYMRLKKRAERQRSLITQRQEAIKFIKRQDSQRYYTVKTGSLRAQMEDLRIALGLQRIRWDKTIPASCDWMFDASFKIDKNNQIKALESFFSGLPLLPQIHTKDRSATISPLEVIKCD